MITKHVTNSHNWTFLVRNLMLFDKQFVASPRIDIAAVR